MNRTKPQAYTSNEGPIRRPRPAVDVALTLGIGLLLSGGVDQVARRERLPEAVVFAAIWVFAGVFVLRRFAPLSAMVVGSVVLPVTTVTPWFLLVWMAMATVAYGAQSSTPRAAVCALGTSFVAETTVALLVEAHAGRQAFNTGWPVQLMIVQLAAWVTGWSAARGRAHTEGLRRQAEQRAAIQVARARRAVSEERLDIARELHDVVAHSLSVIAVQSGVGNHVIHTRPAQAAAALAAIEEVSRSALIELRSLVGLLRDGDAAEYSPGALADLEGLLARSAQAGVRVDATVSGGLDELPHGLDRAAYRIVQEALTNVAKHAGTDRARLTVSVDDAGIGIEVVDDGAGRAERERVGTDPVRSESSKATAGPNGAAVSQGSATSATSAGSAESAEPADSVGSAGEGEWDRPAGHGLIGMRERAALYGGRVSIGPRAEGGFRVAVWLPVPREQPVYVGAFGAGGTGAA
ncbi:sensor histidine kinase [Embleya hyalina]|uniref:histidine kinase n=1 Tax=Embleya hyalina TaxID=516124 RepID=A0A401YZT9_9ACTN|nr:histidine kinase [Embleya hyalina]GCE00127.1 two-component sensor histidine kinase [Embleya hyalina]